MSLNWNQQLSNLIEDTLNHREMLFITKDQLSGVSKLKELRKESTTITLLDLYNFLLHSKSYPYSHR